MPQEAFVMNEFPSPPGDFRLALIWAGVTLALALIKKMPFGKKEEKND